MTSDLEPTPTRLRGRLTAAQTGPTRTELALSDAAVAGLTGISGGRPLEELVLLASATALVVASAEATGEPGLVAVGPDGPVVFQVDLAGVDSVGDLVCATDAALRQGAPARETGVVVRSARVGPAAPVEASIELVLSAGAEAGAEAGGRRVLSARSAAGEHEQWFLEVVLRAFDTTLACFVEPGRRLATLHRAAPDDVAAAEEWGSAGYDATPVETTLTAPIEAVARAHPDRLAIVAPAGSLTFGELWRAAGLVAARLVGLGTEPGDRVAVFTGKSIDAMPAILGVLRARAAYVPLDTQSPPARVAEMIADAQCRAVLTSGDHADRLPTDQVTVPVPDVAAVVAAVVGGDGTPDLPEPVPSDLAYIIYTSGSTGVPKGVEVPHRAIAGYVRWKIAYDELDAGSRVLQLPSLAFDSSVSDIFPALCAGGALVLADAHQSLPRELAELARRHGVTHATIVPSLYRLLLPELTGTALRLVTVAGEATGADLVERHHAALPGVRLVNEYGPTENSVCATAFDHGTDAGPGWPIGRPIATTVLRVAGADGRPLPAGFVGQVLLTGHGLATGYHDRPELTATAFTADPAAVGGRWYRTGDLAWWRPDGIVEFAGRADDQVKVRGHRVELGEIEHVLTRIAGVEAAAVVAVDGPDGATTLVAFLRAATLPAESVTQAAADRLPPAMLPAHYVAVESVPSLVSGKPDRRRLAVLAAEEIARCAQAGSGTGDGDELTVVVGEIFQAVLGGAPFGPDDDFFLRGGHSLAAVLAIGKIEKRLTVFVDLGDFLDVGTVREVAALVRAADAGSDARSPLPATGDDESLWRLLDDSLDSRG